MFQDELSSKSAKSIFPAPFLDDVLKGLSTDRVAKKSKLGLPWLEDIGKKFVPRSTVNLVLDASLFTNCQSKPAGFSSVPDQ